MNQPSKSPEVQQDQGLERMKATLIEGIQNLLPPNAAPYIKAAVTSLSLVMSAKASVMMVEEIKDPNVSNITVTPPPNAGDIVAEAPPSTPFASDALGPHENYSVTISGQGIENIFRIIFSTPIFPGAPKDLFDSLGITVTQENATGGTVTLGTLALNTSLDPNFIESAESATPITLLNENDVTLNYSFDPLHTSPAGLLIEDADPNLLSNIEFNQNDGKTPLKIEGTFKEVIPEPSTVSLAALAAAGLLRRKRKPLDKVSE